MACMPSVTIPLYGWMIVPCTAAVSLKINFARLQGGFVWTPLNPPRLWAWNEARNSFLALHLAMKLFQSAWLPLTKSHDYCGLDNRWVWLKSCFSTVTGWLQCACLKLGIKYVSTMPLFRGEGPWNRATTSLDHDYGGIRTQKQLWASGAVWGIKRSGIYRTNFWAITSWLDKSMCKSLDTCSRVVSCVHMHKLTSSTSCTSQWSQH